MKVAVFSILVTFVASQSRQNEVGMRFLPGSYPGVYAGPYPFPYPGGYVGGVPAVPYPRIINPSAGYPLPAYPFSGVYPFSGGYPMGGAYPGMPVFYSNKNSGGKS